MQSCGGQLDGTWAVRGICAIDHACTGASHDFSAVGTRLSFTVNKVTVSGGGTAKDTIPLSCWDGATGGDSCTALNSQGGFTCSITGDNCSCSVDYTRVNQGFGTMGYLISGSQVLIGTVTYNYCVFNNVLRLSPDLPGGKTGPVSEYVKQ